MEYIAGAILGLAVGSFAAVSGFDRDRSFCPAVLIEIASYYSLFAVMGASSYSALDMEIAAGLVFAAVAVVGFRTSMWLAAAGIAGRGFFDFFLPSSSCHEPRLAGVVARLLRDDRRRDRWVAGVWLVEGVNSRALQEVCFVKAAVRGAW